MEVTPTLCPLYGSKVPPGATRLGGLLEPCGGPTKGKTEEELACCCRHARSFYRMDIPPGQCFIMWLGSCVHMSRGVRAACLCVLVRETSTWQIQTGRRVLCVCEKVGLSIARFDLLPVRHREFHKVLSSCAPFNHFLSILLQPFHSRPHTTQLAQPFAL